MTRTIWMDGMAMAEEIIQRHPEAFRGVPNFSDVLFVLDTHSAPRSTGNLVLARVSKITEKLTDFIGYGDKVWMLEWFELNNQHLSPNQKKLLMAHELLHFRFDADAKEYKLRGHDVEEFYLIADRFGLHWTNPEMGDVSDILSPSFQWGKIGQGRLRLGSPEFAQELKDAVEREIPGATLTVGSLKQ